MSDQALNGSDTPDLNGRLRQSSQKAQSFYDITPAAPQARPVPAGNTSPETVTISVSLITNNGADQSSQPQKVAHLSAAGRRVADLSLPTIRPVATKQVAIQTAAPHPAPLVDTQSAPAPLVPADKLQQPVAVTVTPDPIKKPQQPKAVTASVQKPLKMLPMGPLVTVTPLKPMPLKPAPAIASPAEPQVLAPQPVTVPSVATPIQLPTEPLPSERTRPHRQLRARLARLPQPSFKKLAGAYHRFNPVFAYRRFRAAHFSPIQLGLFAMAMIVVVIGVAASVNTMLTNQVAATKVSALAVQQAPNAPTTTDTSSTSIAAPTVSPSTPPSTKRPAAAVVNTYAVGPNMPKYLDIPSQRIHTRVLSLGILANGALGTPSNIFDVGWYNQSSLPGQMGAMLVDGHVSSWTAHGSFYGLKSLQAGDTIVVTRGDGQVFTYQVVKSIVYDHNNFDMNTAVNPVDPSKPGLNLITCTGQVIKGTNEFNERILVMTQLVS